MLGTPVGDGDQIVAGAGDAAYSTCTYKTTDADPERTVIVTIHPLTAAETPEAIKDQQETDARTGEFDEIPNLGDFSYWIEDKGELNTFCGPNWIIITADGADGKPDLETAKQLMQVTMTNLYCLPISPTILPS